MRRLREVCTNCRKPVEPAGASAPTARADVHGATPPVSRLRPRLSDRPSGRRPIRGACRAPRTTPGGFLWNGPSSWSSPTAWPAASWATSSRASSAAASARAAQAAARRQRLAERHYAEHVGKPFFASLARVHHLGTGRRHGLRGPRGHQGGAHHDGPTESLRRRSGHDPRRLRPRPDGTSSTAPTVPRAPPVRSRSTSATTNSSAGVATRAAPPRLASRSPQREAILRQLGDPVPRARQRARRGPAAATR